jgi:hypothetical protein
MDRHASAVSNNPRSMDASMKPPISTSKLFPNAPPPHMNPVRVTPARSNMYQAVSSQPTNPPLHSDIYITARTEMETFQLDIDDVKEYVQEIKNGLQTIQKMLRQPITPTTIVKKKVGTEPSGLTASTGGTHGPAGSY